LFFFSVYIKRFINIKFGLAGAFVMGGIVFFINLEHGWILSTTAGLKQWIYTFFFGGIIIKLLERLLSKFGNKFVSISFSVIIVSLVTILLIFFVHSLKGTPEPFLSTIPTILMAPPGFLFLALKFKRNQNKN